MSASDNGLVQRVREGDTGAFDCLVASYEKAVYAIAVATAGNGPEAEDLTQTCFVEAFSRIGELRDGHRFAPWLYAIAHNRCRDWLRQRSRRPILLGDPSTLRGNSPTELPTNPERAVLVSERNATIKAAVDALPPKYRLVVLLRYVGEVSYDEIAEVLSVSVSTAKVRCHRARKMLRQRLADGQGENGHGL